MGLDITAYQGIGFANPALAQSLEEDTNVRQLYINSDFPSRAADLPNPCLVLSTNESFSFRAGSYSGYGVWRQSLALFAGFSSVDEAFAASGGPFWELINFSDCEGVIGPTVSSKLALDFEVSAPKVVEWAKANLHPHAAEHFAEVYADFHKAFALAAQGGAVSFH